jgi:hypothetical protein
LNRLRLEYRYKLTLETKVGYDWAWRVRSEEFILWLCDYCKKAAKGQPTQEIVDYLRGAYTLGGFNPETWEEAILTTLVSLDG